MFSNLGFTFLAAFILIFIALCLLGISLLLTGKMNIHIGRCGRDPNKKRDDACGSSGGPTCSLCEPPEEKEPSQPKEINDDIQEE